ncbi:MAG TPA: peptide deformylase [Bacteroidota bacterium]|nr:peptide deformylase [Bacteroidota bacterium]
MAVRRIRLLGDPILRTKCRPVKDVKSSSSRALARDLRDTLNDFRKRRRFGRGIAAPQIGKPVRMIYIKPKGLGALLNPTITKRSKGTFELWDDCFSFPELLVRVRRYRSIRVTYVDEEGTPRSISATGKLSELLQHEIDHLDGILALDRAISTRSIVLRRWRSG